jgi:hypothetical protein
LPLSYTPLTLISAATALSQITFTTKAPCTPATCHHTPIQIEQKKKVRVSPFLFTLSIYMCLLLQVARGRNVSWTLWAWVPGGVETSTTTATTTTTTTTTRNYFGSGDYNVQMTTMATGGASCEYPMVNDGGECVVCESGGSKIKSKDKG